MSQHAAYECHLPEECVQHAVEVLGETPELRELCITQMHLWLDENPHINAHRDTKTVLHFLRGAKFKMEKAKCKMIRFYKMRAERIEWFENRNPLQPELVELMNRGVFLPLRIKDDQNRQIFIIRTAAHDPKHHSQNDVFKVGKMILDLVLAMDETISVYGIAAIFDMRGVTLAHALHLPPATIKRSVESWDCYPCLTKMLEFVNAPFYVNAFLNTFRFFMSNKLKARTFVTSGKSSINASCLPPELGGTGHSYTELAVYWTDYVQRHAAWFEEDSKYKSTM